ncbi:uncharacterized protein NPIL_43331 [Nephila pilipes]|uniref:Uncharacterized protein n=1 Tax=Nephila pilipes TaxID=299642 RepID=A0A8X6P4A9_NEPPI|nr:uncharacterized protein NPIL_43331 [Nephila pilipes]
MTVRVILHMIDFEMSCAWIGYRHKMEAIRAHIKDIVEYFSFRINIASILIYGEKQSRSRTFFIFSSDKSIEDDEPLAKRRIPVCMPHDSAKRKDTRYMFEMTDDRSQKNKLRMLKCKALTTVRRSSCKIFLHFNDSRNCYKRFH